jgi:hypothetical protein
VSQKAVGLGEEASLPGSLDGRRDYNTVDFSRATARLGLGTEPGPDSASVDLSGL